MSRTLTAGMATAIAAERGEIVHLFELAFSGGTVRYATSSANVSWGGHSWIAIGGALYFEPVQESGDLSAASVNLVLSGVDQGIVAIMLAQNYIGRAAKVYLGHLDPTTAAVIADPLLIFSGLLNGGFTVREVRGQDVGGTGTCEVIARCVDRLAELDQRKGFQTNMTSHNAVHAGDRFFEYVDQLASKKLVWKRTT